MGSIPSSPFHCPGAALSTFIQGHVGLLHSFAPIRLPVSGLRDLALRKADELGQTNSGSQIGLGGTSDVVLACDECDEASPGDACQSQRRIPLSRPASSPPLTRPRNRRTRVLCTASLLLFSRCLFQPLPASPPSGRSPSPSPPATSIEPTHWSHSRCRPVSRKTTSQRGVTKRSRSTSSSRSTEPTPRSFPSR